MALRPRLAMGLPFSRRRPACQRLCEVSCWFGRLRSICQVAINLKGGLLVYLPGG